MFKTILVFALGCSFTTNIVFLIGATSMNNQLKELKKEKAKNLEFNFPEQS